MKQDIFDRIMALPGLRVLEPFYRRHKEALLYLFFGGLTTVISIAVFWICDGLLGINELIANVISWILAVLFAFITNRIWVFSAVTRGAGAFLRQALSFYGGRLFTLGVEELILYVFITLLAWNDLLVKLMAQVVIVVLNYIISKLLVFRKKNSAN